MHDNETLHRLALDAGQIGIWSWEPATGTLVLDARARQIIGLPEDRTVTMGEFEALIRSEDRAQWRAARDARLAPNSNGHLQAEFRITHPIDGRERWIASRCKASFDGDRLDRIVGVFRDITQRYRADDHLRRSEALFSGIVSIAADAIISIDADQHITLFNDGAERIFGYHRDEMLGRPLDLLLPERFRAAHGKHVRTFGHAQMGARRMGERAEIFGLRKGGEEFAAEASISHLEIDGEHVFTVVLRDISERKRAEALLARSHTELEKRVAERTAELRDEMQRREQTQALLVRAQRMEAFGQLTGGIAHDFNNLLTVVIGNLELLEMRLDDEKDRTLLKRAQDAAEMGSRLTSRLLTFARRRQLDARSINLNEHVIGTVDLLRRTLGEPIDLNTRLAPRLWTVRADPSEIENALLNLAINARDAMPKGGQLSIETGNVTIPADALAADTRLPAGDYVRISVTDTGAGMPPEVAARAFEPFFTTKQPGKGTGLGLSTIYGFVEQQGGGVTITSEIGRGTTVTLYLPRDEAGDTTLRSGQAAPEAPSSHGETVLLVEDNAEVREVTRSRLEELGYRVIDAENGPAALEILQSDEPIDIVFSDVVMAGGMSGLDVARWMKANRPRLRVLLASGYADDVLRAQDGQLPEVKILHKPYSRVELAEALREILQG